MDEGVCISGDEATWYLRLVCGLWWGLVPFSDPMRHDSTPPIIRHCAIPPLTPHLIRYPPKIHPCFSSPLCLLLARQICMF